MFLSTEELCHVVMVRSAVKKNRRKSQREAARLQKQADALLAMEEDEEVHFKRPDTVPDTPRFRGLIAQIGKRRTTGR